MKNVLHLLHTDSHTHIHQLISIYSHWKYHQRQQQLSRQKRKQTINE